MLPGYVLTIIQNGIEIMNRRISMQDYTKNELCGSTGHDYKTFAEWGRVKMIDGVEKCRRCGW